MTQCKNKEIKRKKERERGGGRERGERQKKERARRERVLSVNVIFEQERRKKNTSKNRKCRGDR